MDCIIVELLYTMIYTDIALELGVSRKVLAQTEMLLVTV